MKFSQKLFNFSSLLVLTLLLTAATCGVQPPSVSDTNGCIDSSKIKKDAVCTMDYRPVCGCDGETYSNLCTATNAGVLFVTEGECGQCVDVAKMDFKKPCTKEYKPVCGCNDVTYGNECMATKAGVTNWTEGDCKDKKTENNEIGTDCYDPKQARMTPCTKDYKPVCGCNGKTYGNACMARNSGVLKWEDGKCPSTNTTGGMTGKDCIDPKKIKITDCPEIYKPVCGCDGKTYTNKCEAGKDGLTKWTEGPCNK